MSSTVLDAIDEEIKNREAIVEKLNASIQSELIKIQALKNARNSIAETMNVIVPVDKPSATIETLHVVVPVVKPCAHVVEVIEKPITPVETVDVKSFAPVVQVIEEPIAHSVPVKKTTKKTVVQQYSLLSPDDYLSVDKKRSVLSNDKKLTDCDFDIRHLFDVKCIHKEKGKAQYNLYEKGQLLHWINDKGEYNSTYMSETQFTPFGPNNDDPFKAPLYGRGHLKVKGKIFFGTQSDPISKKTSAKTSEQTSAKTSTETSELNMDDVSVFPVLRQ
jgi:hypothetical protein